MQVIADALADSVQVALISGTLSDNGDEVADSVLRQLGPDIGGRVRVFNCNQSRGEPRGSGPGGLFAWKRAKIARGLRTWLPYWPEARPFYPPGPVRPHIHTSGHQLQVLVLPATLTSSLHTLRSSSHS